MTTARHCINGARGRRKERVGRATSSTAYWPQVSGTSSATASASSTTSWAPSTSPTSPATRRRQGADRRDGTRSASTASSVMEYNAPARRAHLDAGLGHVRQRRYRLDLREQRPAARRPHARTSLPASSPSARQACSATYPYKDPLGFCADGDLATRSQRTATGRSSASSCAATSTTSSTRRSAASATSASRPSEIIANDDRRLRVAVPVAQLPQLPQDLGRLRLRQRAGRASSSTCAASSRCGPSTGARASSPTPPPHRHHAPRRRTPARRSTTTTSSPTSSTPRCRRPTRWSAAFHKAIIQQSVGRAPLRDRLRQVLRRRDPAGHHPRQALRHAGLRRAVADGQLRPEPGRRLHLVLGHRRLRRSYQYVAEDAVTSMIGVAVRRLPVLRPDRGGAVRAGHPQPGVPRRAGARRDEGLDRRLDVRSPR